MEVLHKYLETFQRLRHPSVLVLSAVHSVPRTRLTACLSARHVLSVLKPC